MSKIYGYPEGWKLKLISDQARIWMKLFPGIEVRDSYLSARYQQGGKTVLPENADGFVVIPKHSVLARYSKANEKWPVYNRALGHVHATLKATRPDFVDYTDGRIGPEYERMTGATKEVFDELEKLPGDVIILAVQTGILHRNESVFDARSSFKGQEFGLDSASTGSILLTHPERLNADDHLAIDCSGSERAPRMDGQFHGGSYFAVRRGRFGFNGYVLRSGSPFHGSASVFLPAN